MDVSCLCSVVSNNFRGSTNLFTDNKEASKAKKQNRFVFCLEKISLFIVFAAVQFNFKKGYRPKH